MVLFWVANFRNLTPVPQKPDVQPADGLSRTFRCYRVHDQAEWNSRYQQGVAAETIPGDDKTGYAVFNWDAFPADLQDGTYRVADVLALARWQDTEEARGSNVLIEDFILHEVGGHHIWGVNAAHNAPHPACDNTLIVVPPSGKLEVDRQALRDAIMGALDGLEVHIGLPP